MAGPKEKKGKLILTDRGIDPKKIALGTASLLPGYGITPSGLADNQEEVFRLFRMAREAGIHLIDTAPVYGNAEELLGWTNKNDFQIITKIPPLSRTLRTSKQILQTIGESLKKTGAKKFKGVLFHDPEQLDTAGRSTLLKAAHDLLRQGLAEKIGLSVYDPENIARWLGMFPFQIVQMPLNPFDQRFEISGWIQRLQDSGIEVHARSVFLQGALFLRPGQLPPCLVKFRTHWEAWHQWLAELRISPLAACLSLVSGLKGVSAIVLGVQSSAQLGDILRTRWPETVRVPEILSAKEKSMIDPRSWGRT